MNDLDNFEQYLLERKILIIFDNIEKLVNGYEIEAQTVFNILYQNQIKIILIHSSGLGKNLLPCNPQVF